GIIGYITRGRGVTVHRSDCANMLGMIQDENRFVEVSWNTGKDQSFLVGIAIEGRDRAHLLSDIGRAISASSTNIQAANMSAHGGSAEGQFIIEVRNLQHLQKVVKSLERVKGVERVERIIGGIDGH
ncbi:ACT domain-containing protein, partial [Gemmatimonadota bacterium]